MVSAFGVWGMPEAAEAVVVGHAGCESGREFGGPAQDTACLGAPLSSSSSSLHTCSLPPAGAVAGEVVAVGPPRSEDPPHQSSALRRGCCLEHSWGKLASRAGSCCLGGTCPQLPWPLWQVCRCHPHSLCRAVGCNSPWPAVAADHSSAQPDLAAYSSPVAMSPVRLVGSFAVCHGNHTFLEKTAWLGQLSVKRRGGVEGEQFRWAMLCSSPHPAPLPATFPPAVHGLTTSRSEKCALKSCF